MPMKNFRRFFVDHNIDMCNYIDMKTSYSRSIPAKWKDIARVFVALGDEQRQRILLSFEPGERLNVGQVAEGSTLARSTVSHHLKVLHGANVLGREKVAKEVFFWINKKFLQEVFGNVTDYLQNSI
jgi:DNA-binding transcriptional ArsR family regulator